jgi:GNAT superfamily N-acetyltransferase
VIELAVSARAADTGDLPALSDLYGALQTEMTGLKPVWAWTDGLAEPVSDTWRAWLGNPDRGIEIGQIDGVPVGFLAWEHRDLLPQADGRRIAAIELIFTLADARRVGVGEAMMNRFLTAADAAGIQLFDATAPPGHRHAKNFFESNGFKARRIIMHRAEG